MNNVIGIGDVLPDLNQWQIIDVRAPGEFLAGHIPGAVNIPLFSDEERAKVGTLYKQVSPEAAMKQGLSFAGAKMNHILEQAALLSKDSNKINLIHCWRGGKRSEAIHWLLTFSGISASRLEGGYKSFRTAVQAFFNDVPHQLNILGGCTGSGKTEILREIARKGHQVIDLESLAHHKGSAFGSIGEEDQPTNEQFENDLYTAFLPMDMSRPIWLENESKSIGRIHIPDGLWYKMKGSQLYNIEVDKETRLDRALKYYSDPASIEMLIHSFEKIHKRLGGLEFQKAIKALHEGDLRTAASIALVYYDKSYTFQLHGWPSENVVHLTECEDVSKTADRLIN